MNLSVDWHPEVKSLLSESNYTEIAAYYEQQLDEQPEIASHYWYLGLAYLLQGDEEAAQTTWLFGLAQFEESSSTLELATALRQEAERQYHQNELRQCWLIRQCLFSIQPQNLDNIQIIIHLLIHLEEFEVSMLEELQLITAVKNADPTEADFQLFQTTIQEITEFPATETCDFIRACIPHYVAHTQSILTLLIESATRMGYEKNFPGFGIELIKLCLDIQPDCLAALEHLPRLYQDAKQFNEAIEAAERFIRCTDSDLLKFIGHSMLLKSLICAGDWQRIPQAVEIHKQCLAKLIEVHSTNLPLEVLQISLIYAGFLAYAQDNLVENRWFHRSLGNLLQDNLKANTSVAFPLFLSSVNRTSNRLKIGYVAHTLTRHSVGWLSRWLFQHHDRKQFDISVYLFRQSTQDPFFQNWIAPHVDFSQNFGSDIPALAEKVRDDQIQVLIDLDSLTLDYTCMAMSVKPAPVQVTWLGWDASGLPSIDYFIADPYVLPENAEQHYNEKIWRLPQTYLAVQGFEAEVPTLRRSDLSISSDAVVYLTAQVALKRNPHTMRLQLKILKEVPHSYLLIKGLANQEYVQAIFLQIAQEEGVSADRLKFLPMVENEYIHRANLNIADVVLDTYPYNGATTTLETLWMGVPLVTRVGTTFSARNSYTFLRNVGVSEGVAWTDDEYIEWGVRFGRDETLRQNVSWRLRQSRRTAPLWNVPQFVQNMENAYTQMWQTYLKNS
jgi:predicted O-linked N-acetylglucosamine transferase (SPINDLY family)